MNRCLLVVVSVAVLTASSAFAQGAGTEPRPQPPSNRPRPAAVPAAPSGPWTLQRTEDGQPDVQGFWTRGVDGGGLDAAYGIEHGQPEEEQLVTDRRRTLPMIKVIVDPPDGLIPYQPWAKAVADENRKHVFNPTKPEHLDSYARCFSLGTPRHQFLGQFRILQVPGYVLFVYSTGNIRHIALDGRAHMSQKAKFWMGDSVGRWEGNTLHVDVRNINEYAWYDVVGNFHSRELRVEERWIFTDRDTLTYEAVQHDPKVYTRPWTLRNQFARNTEAGYEEWESACIEGERGVELSLTK